MSHGPAYDQRVMKNSNILLLRSCGSVVSLPLQNRDQGSGTYFTVSRLVGRAILPAAAFQAALNRLEAGPTGFFHRPQGSGVFQRSGTSYWAGAPNDNESQCAIAAWPDFPRLAKNTRRIASKHSTPIIQNVSMYESTAACRCTTE